MLLPAMESRLFLCGYEIYIEVIKVKDNYTHIHL